jgi:glycosyltransferase involved in cell wall biosynthesis
MTTVERPTHDLLEVAERPGGWPTTARVSCVIIFLDGAAFIDEAIRSVVGQEGFDDWELLLVDDGSTDESTAIALRWASDDARIHYLEHEGHANRGMSASRNLGLSHARGDYVGFLDCDDVWLPGKLASQVALLDRHPEVDATYGPTLVWYGWTGDVADVARDRLGPIDVPSGTIVKPPTLLEGFRRSGGSTVPAICSVLVRREALLAVGGFDDRFRGSYEDQVFYSKMGLHMSVLVTDECLDRYRQHPDSTCARGIAELSYHPELLNPTEERFLHWLADYLGGLGLAGSELWHDVQRSLRAYRRFSPSLLGNQRWRRSALGRLRRRVQPAIPPRLFRVLRVLRRSLRRVAT